MVTPPSSAPPDDGGTSGTAGREDALPQTVASLTAAELEPAQRRRLLGRLANQVRARGPGRTLRVRALLRWVADSLVEIAPHIPIRDLETLRRHHDGLAGEALAERLVRHAARATAAVGAASGGVAAVKWAAPPALLSAPALLAAETLAVVAIEVKLIGELHEVYRQPLPGTGTQRAVTLLQAWAGRRGFNPTAPGAGIATVLSTAARKELRERLVRRFGRNLTTLGPLLTGAAVAGYLNHRATRALGEQMRRDLARGYVPYPLPRVEP
jgi:hypothetical protein